MKFHLNPQRHAIPPAVAHLILVRSMRPWPKFLGLGLAVFAIGCVMFTAGDLFRMGLFTESPVVRVSSWLTFSSSCILLILSYPLYRGQNWARLILVGIALLAFIAVLWFSVSEVARQHLAVDGDASRLTAQEISDIHREEFISRSMSVGAAIIFLTPLAWLLCLLCHSDVVGAFRKPHAPRQT